MPDTVMPRHDHGCRCYPHVAESDALQLVGLVGQEEYRDAKRQVAEAVSDERARIRAAVEGMPPGSASHDEAYALGWDDARAAVLAMDRHLCGYCRATFPTPAEAIVHAAGCRPLDEERLARALATYEPPHGTGHVWVRICADVAPAHAAAIAKAYREDTDATD